MSTKYLIISNNCLSANKNNGKTLYNIFYDEIVKENVSNLYFSYEIKELNIPTFNINEKKMMHLIKNNSKIETTSTNKQSNINVKPNEFYRILRELIWIKLLWNTKEFNSWLETLNPQIIFFMAGDSIFAYRIVKYIKNKFNCKLYVYYTDDYYFKTSKNLIFKIRSLFVKKNIKNIISKANKLFFISEMMERKYNEIFHCKGNLLGLTLTNLNKNFTLDNINKKKIIYTGNLELGRMEVIKEFAKKIEKIVKDYPDIQFDIYTGSIITEDDKKFFSKLNNTRFMGFVESEELYAILKDYNFLLFVESFLDEFKEVTRYSFSTKIMEYLCSNKCIITIGPEDISSIKVLKKCSIYLDNLNIEEKYLLDLLNDKKSIEKHIKKSKEIFNEINALFENSKKILFEK